MQKVKSKQELLKEVNKYSPIIEAINSVSSRVIKDDDEKQVFEKISKSLDKWKIKLNNPKFEVAIIGLEKAGKSTMANALLNQDYLPNAISRCTFTTAKIESHPTKDEAIINFYTDEEFTLRFQALCEKIKLPDLNFDSLSIKELDKIVKEKDFNDKPNEVKDIEIMIKNRDELYNYINQPEKIITENIQKNVEPYIVAEDRSMAVKNITIKSTQLKDMEDIVIYDVPGFDSPTKLHLEQAKKYTDEADVIIMMISIADRVSFTDPQVEFLNQTAKDGVSLIDKTIVIASKFDKHIIFNNQEGSNTQIQEYMTVLDKELKKYNIYRKQNIFKVSPRAYLEGNGKLEKDPIKGHLALPAFESVNIGNGFKEFRQRLNEFFQYDALKAMNDNIKKDLNNTQNFLLEFKEKHNVINNEMKIKEDVLKIKKEYKKALNIQLKDIVENFQEEIRDKKDFNIRAELEEEILEKWLDKLYVTDEKREQYQKFVKIPGGIDIEIPADLNRIIRKDLYNKSLKFITDLVSDVLVQKDATIMNEFRESIIKAFKVENNQELKDKLLGILNTHLMAKYSYDEKSYKPLVSRFINDIFKLIIFHPITNQIKGARIMHFSEVKQSIMALAPFDEENYKKELDLGVFEKNIVKKILVQFDDKAKNIDDKTKKGLERLLLNAKVATTYVEVQEEINTDLEILNYIISNILLRAMMIEKPFIDSLFHQVESIEIDIIEEDKLYDFMDLNIEVLEREKYNDISGDPELNKKISDIILESEKVL